MVLQRCERVPQIAHDAQSWSVRLLRRQTHQSVGDKSSVERAVKNTSHEAGASGVRSYRLSQIGVHTTRLLLLRLRFSRLFRRISLSERQVHSLLASISRDRPTTLLRATVRSQLLERCAPSRAG